MRDTIVRPSYIPDKYDGYAFIKFFKEENFLNDFISGKLYMGSKEKFAMMESIGRSDELENKFIISKPTMNMKPTYFFQKMNDKNIIVFDEVPKNEFDDGSLLMIHDRNAERTKIFCLYTIWFNTESGEIYEISEEMESNFGDYCAFIFNPEEFLKIVENGLEQNKCNKIDFGFVDYYNLEDSTFHIWNTFKKPYLNYHYQNEFRISILTDNDDDHIIYNLESDITNICTRTKYKDIIDGKIFVRDGYIYMIQE